MNAWGYSHIDFIKKNDIVSQSPADLRYHLPEERSAELTFGKFPIIDLDALIKAIIDGNIVSGFVGQVLDEQEKTT